MSNVNTNIIWTELRANILNIPIDSDVICTICKQIMMNARCAPCGCRYCFVCISTYLNGQNKTCPGQTINCKDELVILNGNTFNDHGINRKISRMIVKCPVKYCKFKDEVRNIEHHMQSCFSKNTVYPFSNIGSQQTNIAKENMNKHYQDELMQHSKLLLDRLEKIEIVNKALKEENEMLKQDKNVNQLAIWEIQKNANESRNKINEMEQEIAQLKTRLKFINDPKMRMISYKDSKEDQMKETIEYLKSKLENMYKENIYSSITEKIFSKDCEEKKFTNKNGVIKTFSWEINKFFTKMKENHDSNKTISSDSFYTHKHGYKLHLELNLNSYSSGKGTPIYISYCLMEGDYDDNLLWPCKFDVQFDLINPYTNKLYTRCNIYDDYLSTHPGKMKPGLESFPVGCRLVKQEDILNIKDWRKTDQIIVDFTISFDKY